jgi:hypothetical protein
MTHRTLAAMILGILFLSTNGSGAQTSGSGKPHGRIQRTTAGDSEQVRYEWSDPNTMNILKWEGDTPVVEPGSQPRLLAFTVRISLDLLHQAVQSYGIPDSWLTINYKSAQELTRKQSELKGKAAARGIDYDVSASNYLPSFSWIVSRSRQDLRETAAGLSALAKNQGYSNGRGMFGMIASMIQSTEYRVPPEQRIDANGQKIHTMGIMMPLETLYSGWGDCDSRSLLLAAIVANFGRTAAVLVTAEDHAFLGIRMAPRVQDRYITIRGIPYVLIESTDYWPIGSISDEVWKTVKGRKLRVWPLFDNN